MHLHNLKALWFRQRDGAERKYKQKTLNQKLEDRCMVHGNSSCGVIHPECDSVVWLHGSKMN